MPAHAAPVQSERATPPDVAFRAFSASLSRSTGPFLPARHDDLDLLDASARSAAAASRARPPSCDDALRLFRRCTSRRSDVEGFACGAVEASYLRCAGQADAKGRCPS